MKTNNQNISNFSAKWVDLLVKNVIINKNGLKEVENMKDTGVYRAVDEFGRFVVPKIIRKDIGITDSIDSLDMFLIDTRLYLRKAHTGDNQICINRKVDMLGRIVIPKEILKTLKYDTASDQFHILTDENNCIVLEKVAKSCIFCLGQKSLVEFSGKMICKNCIKKISVIK